MSEPITPSTADSSVFGVPRERKSSVYIAIDCGAASPPMLEAFEQGIRLLTSEAMSLPPAVELMWLSVIAYGETAEQMVPLTPLTDFSVPKLRGLGSVSRLSSALSLLADCIQREVQPRDYKPQILVLTSSRPDRPVTAAELTTIGCKRCKLLCLVFGDQVTSDDFPPGFFVAGSNLTPDVMKRFFYLEDIEDDFRFEMEQGTSRVLLVEINPGRWVELGMPPEGVRLARPSLPPLPAGFELAL